MEERFTAKEIKSKLLDALHQDPGIDTSRIKLDASNKKSIGILKLFFQLSSSKSNGVLKYEIQGTYWANILNNTTNLIPSNLPVSEDGYPTFWADIA